VVPSAVRGISEDEKKRREFAVLEDAATLVKSRLDTEWCQHISPNIEFVPLGSQSELYVQYAKIMKFCHASASVIGLDETMQNMREEAREMHAHCIRTHNYTQLVTHLPHMMYPDIYGTSDDCKLCSQVSLTPESTAMINDMMKNNGFFYAPSWAASAKEHCNTFFEERSRAETGEKGNEPDTLFNYDRTETKSYPGSLYPSFSVCPHPGCYRFGFRCASESYRHELVYHPAERKQRLQDARRAKHNLAALPRVYVCNICKASFSSRRGKQAHCASFGHQSQATTKLRANVAERQTDIPPPMPTKRRLQKRIPDDEDAEMPPAADDDATHGGDGGDTEVEKAQEEKEESDDDDDNNDDDDNDDDDDIDDDEPLQPLEIVKEFWGPKKGKDAMSQRLYDVRFSDGSTQAVLVEDTIDKERAVIDESFYRKVIKSWRQINPEIPKKPSAATKRNRHVI